jgi:hypothetical protein
MRLARIATSCRFCEAVGHRPRNAKSRIGLADGDGTNLGAANAAATTDHRKKSRGRCTVFRAEIHVKHGVRSRLSLLAHPCSSVATVAKIPFTSVASAAAIEAFVTGTALQRGLNRPWQRRTTPPRFVEQERDQ